MNPTLPTPDQQPLGQVPEIPAVPDVAPAQTPAPAVPAPIAQPAGTPVSDPALPATPVADLATPVAAEPAPAITPITGAPPAVAEDVDVIEKEWVDTADATVKRTEGDPHAEEEAIEALQIDYLEKRYDHTVEKPAE